MSTTSVRLHVTSTTRDRAKRLCQMAEDRGELSWSSIAVEELAEAVEQGALGDAAKLRAELVQTAAVIVAWIEALDRRQVRGAR